MTTTTTILTEVASKLKGDWADVDNWYKYAPSAKWAGENGYSLCVAIALDPKTMAAFQARAPKSFACVKKMNIDRFEVKAYKSQQDIEGSTSKSIIMTIEVKA